MDAGTATAESMSAKPAASGMSHALRAFRHRDFSIFFTGAVVSNSGTWLQGIAVPYVLFQLTGSATWVGLATFATFIPIMVLGPIGGALADRFSRRRILMIGQSFAALFALALYFTYAAGVREPAVVLLLTSAMSASAGLTIPAWQAFVPALVPHEDLPSAITLNSVQFNAARAIGPAMAGVVLASWGASAAFLLNAASYVAVIVALALLRVQVPRLGGRGGSVLRGFRAAFTYLTHRAGIWRGIVLAMLLAFLGNPMLQFTVVWAEEVYDVGPEALGVLTGAIGLGAIAVAPWVAGAMGDIARAQVVRIGLPVYGAAVLGFGLSTAYWVGVACAAVVGAGFLAVIATTNTAAQSIVAEHFRGRVMAIRVMGFTAAYPLGGLLQGWLADRIDPAIVVATAGGILLVVGLWFAWQPGWLTPLDDPPDAFAPDEA